MGKRGGAFGSGSGTIAGVESALTRDGRLDTSLNVSRGGGAGQARQDRPASASTGGVQGDNNRSQGEGGSDTSPPVREEAKIDSGRETTEGKIEVTSGEDIEVLFVNSGGYARWTKESANLSEKAADRLYDKRLKEFKETLDIKVSPAPPAPIDANFTNDIDFDTYDKFYEQLDKIPLSIQEKLNAAGVKVHVGPTADKTDRWAGYLAETGSSNDDKIADGRYIRELSFYDSDTKDIFISTDSGTGSVNLPAHESAHAVDELWLDNLQWEVDRVDANGNPYINYVEVISRDDEDWINLHNDYILNNPNFIEYYRLGSEGDDISGRSEFWAEGMAAYFDGGYLGLLDFLDEVPAADRGYVADKMIEIWKYWSII